jgi:hypothetical protein
MQDDGTLCSVVTWLPLGFARYLDSDREMMIVRLVSPSALVSSVIITL